MYEPTTTQFPSMVVVNSTAVHHRASYDYCHECGRLFYVRNVMTCRDCTQRNADAQERDFKAKRGPRYPILAAALLALLPLTTHAQAPDPRIAQATVQQAQPAPLAEGCAITGATSEGFPVATCASGEVWYADMDGAGGYNSGLPYVEPGTWVHLP